MTRFGIMVCFLLATTTRITSSFRLGAAVRRSITPMVTSTSSRLYMSTTTSTTTPKPKKQKQKPIPMTLLSGFLGSGKTTTLKHLLENKQGCQVGVIVNDVASVNIDAKLVSSTTTAGGEADLIELENGCACCSLADELFTSVEKLLIGRKKKKQKEGKKQKMFDAIVIELSGVADPQAIESNWNMAAQRKLTPVTSWTYIDRVVTLVDACTFGSDWMTVDLASDRPSWNMAQDDCGGVRKVTELLAEQVEAAHLIVLNKMDLASPEEAQVASAVAQGLNPKATVERVEFGQIAPQLILGESVFPTTKEEKKKNTKEEKSSSCCSNPDCSSNKQESDSSSAAAAAATESSSSSHEHSHSHDSAAAATAAAVDSTTSSSSDATTEEQQHHSHSHSHSHDSPDQLGIQNFVYKRSRPFDAGRLLTLLNGWPIPIKENLDWDDLQTSPETVVVTQTEGGEDDDNDDDNASSNNSPFQGVLRSKGFCWMAPQRWTKDDNYRHDTAMYWSHAGKHLGVTSAGKWWGTITKEEMEPYFKSNPQELQRIIKEDFVSDEWGDRRQELVFIGTGDMDEEAIAKALDDCLLTPREMKSYQEEAQYYELGLSNNNNQRMEFYDPN